MFMTAYLETLTDSRRPWRCPTVVPLQQAIQGLLLSGRHWKATHGCWDTSHRKQQSEAKSVLIVAITFVCKF